MNMEYWTDRRSICHRATECDGIDLIYSAYTIELQRAAGE